MTGLSANDAAQLLGVSAPTIHAMVDRGDLVGSREPWGTRFKLRVDATSVQALAATRAAGGADSVAAQLLRLEERVKRLEGAPPSETSSLPARVIELEDALIKARGVLELREQIEEERAKLVAYLLEAVAAGERVDALRRHALTLLGEAVPSGLVPADPGELT